MTRKLWMLIALTVVLGGISLYLNTDWFSKEDIHIVHRSRAARAGVFRRRGADHSTVNPVFFVFDRKLKLTALRVIPLSAIQTNKYPEPVWHLVSDSNSVPTKELTYGSPVKGMRPAVKGAAPDALDPGVAYRLFVEAGAVKAEHDFTPEPKTP